MSINKNKQEELKISKHLQDLIDAANNTIKTVKEQILEIYHTAKSEGFTPLEARMLIAVKVVFVSDRYLREILPEEAKNKKMIRHKASDEDEGDEDESDVLEEFEDDDEEDEKIPTDDVKIAEQVPQIPPPKYNIKEAEIGKEYDLPEPTSEFVEEENKKEVVEESKLLNKLNELKKYVHKLEEENAKLRMKQVPTFGNKFDFSYTCEMPNGDFVPFIVTVFPDKKDGYMRVDKKEIERLKQKEELRNRA